MMVAARRNYKIYADIGSANTALTRRLAAVDTAAWPDFIRTAELSAEETYQITARSLPDIWDDNCNPIQGFRDYFAGLPAQDPRETDAVSCLSDVRSSSCPGL